MKGELLITSKFRHSSVGWNPVHRIFKHLEGLGPSLRWDDGVIRSSQRETLALARILKPFCLKTPANSGVWFFGESFVAKGLPAFSRRLSLIQFASEWEI